MLLLAQLWGENSPAQRVHAWFTLPLSSFAISPVGCGARQGALWVPFVWIYSGPGHSSPGHMESLKIWWHYLYENLCWPQSPRQIPLFISCYPYSSTWLHYKLFPNQWWGVARGSYQLAQSHVPCRQNAVKGSPLEGKAVEVGFAELLLCIRLGW